jgi:hypothetical protein
MATQDPAAYSTPFVPDDSVQRDRDAAIAKQLERVPTLDRDQVAVLREEAVQREHRRKVTLAELEVRFTYHAPKPGQKERYEELRYQAKRLAELIVESTPDSREQSLALTALEEAVMWANAAIARREPG